MTESYNLLLKEHIVHALTNPQAGTLKDFVQQLINQNSAASEEIIKAYIQIHEELVGMLVTWYNAKELYIVLLWSKAPPKNKGIFEVLIWLSP